ncbi:hypothetical protein EYC84_004268 [Monilinia fructicola]|uniref:Uncharacterized protein n=1 Tax=Monilinia fructicola TaxID=38448 RepID=A0A5M9JZS6_MONFR|nr:hypothetical protein EYC84_004268 [Monilinia fructicola]
MKRLKSQSHHSPSFVLLSNPSHPQRLTRLLRSHWSQLPRPRLRTRLPKSLLPLRLPRLPPNQLSPSQLPLLQPAPLLKFLLPHEATHIIKVASHLRNDFLLLSSGKRISLKYPKID